MRLAFSAVLRRGSPLCTDEWNVEPVLRRVLSKRALLSDCVGKTAWFLLALLQERSCDGSCYPVQCFLEDSGRAQLHLQRNAVVVGYRQKPDIQDNKDAPVGII